MPFENRKRIARNRKRLVRRDSLSNANRIRAGIVLMAVTALFVYGCLVSFTRGHTGIDYVLGVFQLLLALNCAGGAFGLLVLARAKKQ